MIFKLNNDDAQTLFNDDGYNNRKAILKSLAYSCKLFLEHKSRNILEYYYFEAITYAINYYDLVRTFDFEFGDGEEQNKIIIVYADNNELEESNDIWKEHINAKNQYNKYYNLFNYRLPKMLDYNDKEFDFTPLFSNKDKIIENAFYGYDEPQFN